VLDRSPEPPLPSVIGVHRDASQPVPSPTGECETAVFDCASVLSRLEGDVELARVVFAAFLEGTSHRFANSSLRKKSRDSTLECSTKGKDPWHSSRRLPYRQLLLLKESPRCNRPRGGSAAQEGEDARQTATGCRAHRRGHRTTGLRHRRGIVGRRGTEARQRSDRHRRRRSIERSAGVPGRISAGGRLHHRSCRTPSQPRQGRGLPNADRSHQRGRCRPDHQRWSGRAAPDRFCGWSWNWKSRPPPSATSSRRWRASPTRPTCWR
jgi:hypothetical protein